MVIIIILLHVISISRYMVCYGLQKPPHRFFLVFCLHCLSEALPVFQMGGSENVMPVRGTL